MNPFVHTALKLRWPAENLFLLVSRINTNDLVFLVQLAWVLWLILFYLLVLGLVGSVRLVVLVWAAELVAQ